jgi:hypothetical protein
LGRGNSGGRNNNGRAFFEKFFFKNALLLLMAARVPATFVGTIRVVAHRAARRAIFFVTFSFLLTSPFQIARNRMAREILTPFFP